MLTYAKYKRYWAVYEDRELHCLTIYKKDAPSTESETRRPESRRPKEGPQGRRHAAPHEQLGNHEEVPEDRRHDPSKSQCG
jgi:hypothetical protein